MWKISGTWGSIPVKGTQSDEFIIQCHLWFKLKVWSFVTLYGIKRLIWRFHYSFGGGFTIVCIQKKIWCIMELFCNLQIKPSLLNIHWGFGSEQLFGWSYQTLHGFDQTVNPYLVVPQSPNQTLYATWTFQTRNVPWFPVISLSDIACTSHTIHPYVPLPQFMSPWLDLFPARQTSTPVKNNVGIVGIVKP